MRWWPQRAEDFLKAALRVERFAGGAFDFISVCPPYLLVDYNELYDLLENSPLVRQSMLMALHLPYDVTQCTANMKSRFSF